MIPLVHHELIQRKDGEESAGAAHYHNRLLFMTALDIAGETWGLPFA